MNDFNREYIEYKKAYHAVQSILKMEQEIVARNKRYIDALETIIRGRVSEDQVKSEDLKNILKIINFDYEKQ